MNRVFIIPILLTGYGICLAMKLGEKAEVLVDLGHHPLGTNIEHIVAFLLEEKIGGFHFNNKNMPMMI